MTKETLRIVYMGTPDFAVESLRVLVEGGYNVVAVVTMPDKPMGRHGSVLQPSPVKQYATEHGLKVMQPEKLKDPAFIEELKALNADLQVVVAFRMLPEAVWSMPRCGTINAHASLLPKYRGAAPINWAIINGEKETGVTTFMLKHEIDTGDIIDQVRIPIGEEDNAETVHDKLMVLSGQLVVKTVDSIIDGTFKTTPQDAVEGAEVTQAPKIFRDTCRIDWNKPAQTVRNFIRGLSPYPAAWTTLGGKSVKIFDSTVSTETSCTNNENIEAGAIRTDGKKFIQVRTADAWLDIKTLQLEGKKKMSVEDLLRGLQLPENAFFQ